MLEIEIRPLAKEEMIEIWLYVKEQSSSKNGSNVLQKIEAEIFRLSKNSFIGSPVVGK